ncbi:MAG: nickel-responsive transcriptional regulator NikR [Chitinispirillaceae bacterium]|nr:nickel-responsive transcriptional regulator NikR [Chitinispirillaceae bacterium]
MGALYRFGVSLEKELIDEFDAHVRERNYPNRSEAIRDLIRQELTKREWATGGVVAGAVVMTYDHHKRELVNKLLDVQHDYQDCIISTQHVHLDHHHCLEIIAVRGNARDIERLAGSIKSYMGVKQVSMSLSMAGE